MVANRPHFRILVVLLAIAWPLGGSAADRPQAAAVASAHPLATAAGRDILESGGNAFDAAIAVAAALAVAEPYASGLGGGGFFLLHRAADARDVMIDARERAPLAARADMYLDARGAPVPDLSLYGPLAAAVPGLPAGLAHLADRYGTLPLKRTLAPAIALARQGFPVTARYVRMAERARRQMQKSPAASAVFLDNGSVPAPGFVLRQPDLAGTLEQIAAAGALGFYGGRSAQRLVEGVRAAGGIWTLKDLAEYRVLEREPLRARYRGLKIITAPPPGGGVGLLQMLGMLEDVDLDRLASVERVHRVIEAMRRAYRDRALYLGDPDFPAASAFGRLLDPNYLAMLRRSIDPKRATPSASIAGAPLPAGGSHTTHFSIIDQSGNRVAATLTINTGFGSGFMPPGTGVLLNNEMDDFAGGPGLPNVYRLVGSSANAIAPGKRPLSSMTPTFVETVDAVAALGTPGGSRIPTMVLLATLEIAAGRGAVQEWVGRPRFHHQYLPDVVRHEPGAFTAGELQALTGYGHVLHETADRYGNMQAVVWNHKTRRVTAASDPRGEGSAWVGRAR